MYPYIEETNSNPFRGCLSAILVLIGISMLIGYGIARLTQ